MSNSKQVLIIDDDETFVSIVSDEVSAMGFSPVTATSGESALTVIKDNSGIDLILSDYMLGDTNGSDLFLRIREVSKRPIPHIFITGADGDVATELEKLSGSQVIEKPLDYDELERRVRQALFQGGAA